MGANLQEWEFFVSDRGQSTGGSPPDLNDDTGVLYALTVGTADSPTIYTDQNGTSLTETVGVAKMSFSNGHVRFWTDRTVTNLDISWFGSQTCGYISNVTPSRHELPATRNGGKMITAIPIQNTDAASAETSMGFSIPDGTVITDVWAAITSAGTTAGTFDVGIAASAAGGDLNGFLAAQPVSIVRVGVRSYVGVMSFHGVSGLDQQLTYTTSTAVNSSFGALVYLEVNYSLQV